MTSKFGRPCPKGEECHWEALQLPQERGKGVAYWQCKKCKFIEHKEVFIE